jgi:hypothetical protein
MLAGPYRAGPWPGLTPSGAGVLLACAVLLAVGQVLIGPPTQALPDLAVVGVTVLLPIAIAVRIVQSPGAASAVCGAYLMPRALLSLLQPDIELPPLLLVAALAFDVALWYRPRAPRSASRLTRARATVAGAAFGLALAMAEPPFAILQGGDPALWSGPILWVGGAATAIACAVVGRLSARDTATSPRGVPKRLLPP